MFGRNALLVGILCFFAGTPLFADEKKPNVVFILADDLGYGELGCYGQQKIKTPHLDRLAREGMQFMQHYTGAPVCAPARCTLLTGKHLGHAEIRGNRDSGQGGKFPGQWPISAEALTLAEHFKAAAYTTGAFGKWGLGPSNSSGSPIKQGFDRFYGYNCQRNAHSYYPQFLDDGEQEVVINEKPISGHFSKRDENPKAENFRAENYAPDLILKEALKFMDQNKEKSFFLYLPFVEPHVAIHPKQSSIDQYPESWDKDRPYHGGNGYLPHSRPRAAYAAMISDLDAHVGAVLERLKALGLEENTIVVFTSDNGPTHAGGGEKNFAIGGVDTAFFASTTGLRGAKGSCFEGGIRVPCLVRWPGKVPAGKKSEMPSYFPDWFPTLCELTQIPVPEGLDGMSLKATLTAEKIQPRDKPMIWDFHDYGGIVAIREGNWKAVRTGIKTPNKKMSAWMLFDLAKDPKEQNNLAAKLPEQVRAMEEKWLKDRVLEPDFPVPYLP